MRTKLLVLALALAACGDDGNMIRNDGGVVGTPDAPEFAPSITSLTASPVTFAANTPTMVTFSWTLLVTPTYPEPSCTIDNGVGPVMSGVAVPVTITGMTLMTLTCSNRAGMSQRQVILNTLPAAPVIGAFSVTPTSVAPNTPTSFTFTWNYSNSPSPQPTCSIDGGVTNITSGSSVSLTLTQARTFRLRCTSSSGTAYTGTTVADVTVAVNECGTAYAECDPHATCTDTVNSYTCACGANYSGNGDTCSATNVACGATPSLCDTNATCVGTNSCACNSGYVGSGVAGDCMKLRGTFVTSATGNGMLSSWASATGTGLAAADSICVAAAGSLPNAANYIAWMSDSTNDAFCRVQGLSGKKSNNCGLGSLTAAAGPWARIGDYRPAFAALDKLVAPSSITYYAANTNESGVEITSTTDRVLTGTDNTGQYVPNATCGDWLSNSVSLTGAAGEVHGGGSSWTQTGATNPACSGTFHLRCVEKGTGPTLPPRHPTARKAFITSVSGNGLLSGWSDSYGQTSSNAPDAVCQARARYAGYANASTFKAWLAYPSYISTKITQTTASYARPDGVVLGSSRNDMLDNKLAAPWNQTELNTYLTGNGDAGNVVTNIYTSSGSTGQYYGSSSSVCSNWSSSSSIYSWYIGRYDLLDSRAYNIISTSTCDQTNIRFFCVED